VSDLLVASGSGYFEVPIAGFAGACADANHVKFERETEQQRCTRTFKSNATFTAQCEKDFSMARYVQNLWLAK
jgi:trans-2-enoyl-CoA reductase